MKITSISYEEHVGHPAEWKLEKFSLGQTNLIVGQNAAGKSRLLNIINGLSKLVTGGNRTLSDSGTYDIELTDINTTYRYKLQLKGKQVAHEQLWRDEQILFVRDDEGVGTIYAEKIGGPIDFSVPNDVLVVNTKRDKVQHSYLEKVHEWAENLRYYPFGTSLGKDMFAPISEIQAIGENDGAIDATNLAQVYSQGFFRFGDDFDKAILRDMELLGYSCSDVGMEALDVAVIKGLPLAVFFVKENELNTKTNQINMSQGMFRALGLVIHLTYAAFIRGSRTVIIDDIGEGLDFERSSAFVALLIERSEKLDIQLIMTTNDRFVMNDVDLDYWGVISREGHLVRVITKQNSPQVFEDFSFYGLNNFDFFANKLFEKKAE